MLDTCVINQFLRKFGEYLKGGSDATFARELMQDAVRLDKAIIDLGDRNPNWYQERVALNLASILSQFGFKYKIKAVQGHGQEGSDIFSELTVVVANYNNAECLGSFMNGVLCQETWPERLIFLDDASTDGSVELMKGYSDRYQWIEVHQNSSNLGAIESYDRVIRMVGTKYTYCASGNDYLLPGFISNVKSRIAMYPNSGMYYGNYLSVTDDEHFLSIAEQIHKNFDSYMSPERFYAEHVSKEAAGFSLSGATVYRTSYLQEEFPKSLSLKSWCDTYTLRSIGLLYGAVYFNWICMAWRRAPGQYSQSKILSVDDCLGFVAEGLRLMGAEKRHNHYTEEYQTLWAVSFIISNFENYQRSLDPQKRLSPSERLVDLLRLLQLIEGLKGFDVNLSNVGKQVYLGLKDSIV